MKNVAIITLNGYFNYGNRLQNFALQEVIKSLGFNVETIINTSKPLQVNSYGLMSLAKKIRTKSLIEIIKKIKVKIILVVRKSKDKQSELARTKIFMEFTKHYITETSFSISENNIPNDLSDRYDFFITGSDQVWNPSFIHDSSINFLTFVTQKKRIAYAPSFGISKIPSEYNENYKDWIKDINCLSVREDEGALIIKQLTGRNVPVLVDPTLLLTKEEWLSVAKEAKNKPSKPFLLTYFLGGISKVYKKRILKIAKENNLDVINLGDIGEQETYKTGPSEFIDYINDCSVFCTDSFHGTVFSILLEKPFIVYEREGSVSMFSRIDTLLDKFDLSSRKAHRVHSVGNIFEVDYTHVSFILQTERNIALDFLKNALDLGEY